MDPTNDNLDNKALDELSLNIKEIEKELMPQLDMLAEKIPEIYNGYASMVRTLVDTTLDFVSVSKKTGDRIALGAEVTARVITAWGNYKAAVEHNKMLAKYMQIKKTIANNNLTKVEGLLPKLERSNTSSSKLFEKYCTTAYSLENLDEETIKRVAALLLKVLAIHRTNVYLFELCKYLKKEYGAWASGMQTCNERLPDYYQINKKLGDNMFKGNLFDAYSAAANSTDAVEGKQILLLSDYQLSMMALGEKLCKVNLKNANPKVAMLIAECGASESYANETKRFTEHIESSPVSTIALLAALAFFAILWIALSYLHSHDTVRWIMIIGGLSVILRICFRGYKRVLIVYAQNGIKLAEECDSNIERACGKIEQAEVDYSEKDVLDSALKGFLN